MHSRDKHGSLGQTSKQYDANDGSCCQASTSVHLATPLEVGFTQIILMWVCYGVVTRHLVDTLKVTWLPLAAICAWCGTFKPYGVAGRGESAVSNWPVQWHHGSWMKMSCSSLTHWGIWILSHPQAEHTQTFKELANMIKIDHEQKAPEILN